LLSLGAMVNPFNWRCPHCEHDVTITDQRYTEETSDSGMGSEDGALAVRSQFLVCPNTECRHATVLVALEEYKHSQPDGRRHVVKKLGSWRLKPWGAARAFPDYVPAAVRADYEEACSIVELSAKAAATLARRAVQGIVRHFWKVKPGHLKDEIDAVEKMVGHGVDPETFQTLHAIRELGNIGAHPERDINLIVEVEPGEAELLLQAVETLIDDTYIARRKREEHRGAVERLRQEKLAARKPPPGPKSD